MKKHFLLSLFILCLFSQSVGQMDITATGVAVVIDFDNTLSGVNNGQFQAPTSYVVATPSAGELDRDAFQVSTNAGSATFVWPGSPTNETNGQGLSNGGVTNNGVYAFSNDGGTNRFLGVQPIGSFFTPGAIILHVHNNTGVTVDGLDIAYTGFGYSDGADMQADVYFSTDNSTYSQIGSLTYQTTGASSWSSSNLTGSASGLSIPDGSSIYVRWVVSQYTGSGSRSEIGLDDISITLNVGASCPGTPTLASTGLGFTGTDETSTTLSWINGDGANRIVVVRANSAVSATPTDNTTYSADPVLGNGADIGTGEYVVYNGNGSSTTITGLAGGTPYHVAIFEYNCGSGSELYLNPGAFASETSLPEDVGNFASDCITNSTVDLSWEMPTGSYDGIMIFARETTPPSQPTIDANDPSLSSSNADYSASSDIGTLGRLVYDGSGTSLSVSGLPTGANIIFKAYTYRFLSGTLWSDGTQRSLTINLNEISTFGALPSDQQIALSWTNPTSIACFDEIMIVGKDGSAVGVTPSGNGASYSADPIFGNGTEIATGEYVVYKGTGTSVDITGLTNGTTYHFTAFVRDGTEWSTGISLSAIPALVTVLDQGDLVIISVNTDINSGDDEVCFFAFQAIAPGTAIDFTDNGYERSNPGQWGDTEGTIRVVWNGASALDAGTIICIQGEGNTSSDFDVYTCGTLDTDWTISSLNGSLYSFNLNNADEIFIMQNGSWVNPGNSHDADYTGNVLYGWTATGWGVGSGTALSYLYPGLNCFHTDVTGLSNNDKVKYTGVLTSATRNEWIARINNSANWTGYADNSAYNSGGPDYANSNLCLVPITASSVSEGRWTGENDNNWFDCNNWDDRRVPDATVNVNISATAVTSPRIDADANFSDEFGDLAQCNNLSIQALTLELEDVDDILEVNGNLELSGTGALDMDGSGSSDGTLRLRGNWTNAIGTPSSFEQGESTINFDGSTQQTLFNEEEFADVELNNPIGLLLNGGMEIAGTLTFADGIISSSTGGGGASGGSIASESNIVTFLEGSSHAGADDDSHVDGIVAFQGPGTFFFPIGDGINLHTLAALGVSGNQGGSSDEFRSEYFRTNPRTEVGSAVDPGNVGYVSPNEYWILDRAAASSTPKQVQLTYRNPNSGIVNIASAYVVRYTGTLWEQAGGNGHLADVEDVPNNSGTITSAGVSNFSAVTFADNGESFPVELSAFDAALVGEDVQLDWRTESETNNAFFVVERSDNLQTFLSIGEVIGAGTSSQPNEYVFLDEKPHEGLNYYRLKQVDFDGQFSFSHIVAIHIGESTIPQLVGVYPNPTKTSSQVEVFLPQAARLKVKVFAMDGRMVAQQTFEGNEGMNQMMIPFDRLPNGLYVLETFVLGSRFVSRIMKE
ncbi:MAG: T9SS type A sorting domain-containing protein [Bacteroidota bacterium]